MDLNHIQLNTVDVKAQAEFYARYFEFTRQKQHGDGLFLWNPHGFMMAINPLPENPVFPPWYHIGFRLPEVQQVRALFERMAADGVTIKAEYQAFDDFVFYRCVDPTGYVVEVFWEPEIS